LLDELITDLKPQEKADLISIILDVFKGQGDIYPRTPVLRDGVKCLVLFTSDPDAVKSIADRVVVLGSVK
jgi:branched-chain amino acid transport system ATP-binding protein